MATWPGTLPTNVDQNGFGEEQPQGAAIRTPMESGPPKQRNRYTVLNLPFAGIMIMTSAQVDTFWTFYRTTLGNGALKFDGLPHFRTGAAVNHRFNTSMPPKVQTFGGDAYSVTLNLDQVP